MNCPQCNAAVPEGARFCAACGASVIQISGDIARRAEGFAGRLWVLDEVLDWLENDSERFLFITGEPGCGKTALAAWLAGVGPAPETAAATGRLEQVRRLWTAAHFCVAEDRRGTLDPARFAQSLARQLSDRYEKYAEAVLESVVPGIPIQISLEARENRGRMVGLQIDTLILNASVEDIYNRSVREPLEKLCAQQPDLRLFVLVDALDEALTFEPPNIATLLAGSGDLPQGVRFLLSSRNEPKVLDRFKQKRRLNLSGQKYTSEAESDIRLYVDNRMAGEKTIKTHVAGLESPETVPDRLVEQAGGNFLYIQFLLDEVAAGHRSLADLAGLPRGLYGLYNAYLDRIMPDMLQPGASQRWLDDYQPLLGCLSVAVPAAPRDTLPDWLGRKVGQVAGLVTNDLIQIVELVDYDGKKAGGYRLYHRSMGEFLSSDAYSDNGDVTPNRYYTPLPEQHDRIIGYYMDEFKGAWEDCDEYGLRQLVGHLRTRLALEGKPKEKGRLAEALYAIAVDDGFRLAQRENLGDLRASLADLRTALDLALERDDIVDALACIGAYRDTIQSESVAASIFEAVDDGDLKLALRRAEFYSRTPDWARVLMLYLGWEAARVGDEDAAKKAVDQARDQPLVQAHGLCDALVAHTARLLAREVQSQRDAYAWFAELVPGGDPARQLDPYDVAQPVAPAEREALERDLHQRLDELEPLAWEGAAEGVSMVPFLQDDEESAHRAASLQDLLAAFAADPKAQVLFDRALAPVQPNPYPY